MRKSKNLQQILIDPARNNFNMIRLFMALGVLYNHCFVLFNPNGKSDLCNLVFQKFDAGQFAVSGFFLISGMLLSQSFHQTNDRLKFILKRIFRIFPALIVCVILTILLFAALGTRLPLQEYYTSRGTYRYLYNILLNNDYFIYTIPGSFESNFYPNYVNGSLWTLPFELLCYISLFILLSVLYYFVYSSASRMRKLLLTGLALYFLFYIFGKPVLMERIPSLYMGGIVDFDLQNDPLRLYLFFGSGMLLYFLRKYIPVNGVILAILLILLAAKHYFPNTTAASIIEYLNVMYILLFWAGFKPLHKFNWKLDPSYGIYLYAWPVQQVISNYFRLTAYESLLISVPIVAILGILSYVIVERPSLNLAGKIAFRLKSKNEIKKVPGLENFEYS